MWLMLITLFFSFHSLAQTCSLQTHKELGAPVLEELRKELGSCPSNKVHLTFDDGPHTRFTPQIRQELKRRGVKASFFITTTNLEGNSAANAREEVQRLMGDGHLIANHGHDHDAYGLRMDGTGKILEHGFSEDERDFQIKKSVDLLNRATSSQFEKQKHLVFRFPYGRGAIPSQRELEYMHNKGIMKFSGSSYSERLSEYRRQSPALITLASQNFSHLGWNHDSMDTSSIALTESGLKNYIKENIKNLCRNSGTKVSLFHDIKEVNTKAIGPIIDIGRCLGLEFISYDQLIKNKSSLNKGVLISKEDVDLGVYQTMEELLNVIGSAGKIECQETSIEELVCVSQYSSISFKDCEGESSICYQGKWYAKNDPYVTNKCSKRCFSKQLDKYFGQCQGESSVCFDGKWYSKDNQIIQRNCN